MKRYSTIPIISTEESPKRRYINIKYPEISIDFSDIYVYTTIGDRYDILARIYYGDSSLWWVISTANYNNEQNSILPPVGTQIRIPSRNRIPSIVSNFENLNNTI